MSSLNESIALLADDLLFASAIEVDLAGVVPESHWQRLADDGMYGLAAPPAHGGPGLDLPDIIEGLELMAGGCLSTTFTWVQHHGVVMALSFTTNEALRDEYLADLTSGRLRAGIAFAGVVPEPPRMTAERVDGGWTFTGDAPFVSGWGIIHVLQVSARDLDSGDIIGGIIQATEQPGITRIQPQDLLAADATKTVMIRIDDLFVADDRVVSRITREQFLAGQIFGARLNGALPIGLVRRCVRLLDEGGHADAAARLQAECDAVRVRLDAGMADPEAMVAARADAAQLALRASATLVAAGGGPSLVRTNHAQRLAREAVFTLVAASRPELKRLLVDRLSSTDEIDPATSSRRP